MADIEKLRQIAAGLNIPLVQRHIFLCAEQTKPKCCTYEAGAEELAVSGGHILILLKQPVSGC